MIYCGYGIIMDFSALSAAMWWVVFIKNNMVSHRLCDFMRSYTCYGVFYMFYNRRLFVKID